MVLLYVYFTTLTIKNTITIICIIINNIIIYPLDIL